MASGNSTSKRTTESLITEFRAVHGDKYDYSKVVYAPKIRKVSIICPLHGRWDQDFYHHRDGVGCNRCAMVANGSANISVVKYSGKNYPSLKILAKELSINYMTLLKRIENGMSLKAAVEKPYIDRSVVHDGVRYKNKLELHNKFKPNVPYQTFCRAINSGMSTDDALAYIPSHGHSNGILYVITNKVNNKKYVGITTETAERRLASHVAGAKTSARKNSNSLAAAIIKHGVKSFKIETIQHAPNIKELSRLENEAIRGMNTLTPNGYNLSQGGSIGRPRGAKTTALGKTFKSLKAASEYVAEVKGISFSAAQKRICEGNVNTKLGNKLNLDLAREIRARHAVTKESHNSIAKDYGVGRESISGLLRNKTWKEKQAA